MVPPLSLEMHQWLESLENKRTKMEDFRSTTASVVFDIDRWRKCRGSGCAHKLAPSSAQLRYSGRYINFLTNVSLIIVRQRSTYIISFILQVLHIVVLTVYTYLYRAQMISRSYPFMSFNYVGFGASCVGQGTSSEARSVKALSSRKSASISSSSVGIALGDGCVEKADLSVLNTAPVPVASSCKTVHYLRKELYFITQWYFDHRSSLYRNGAKAGPEKEDLQYSSLTEFQHTVLAFKCELQYTPDSKECWMPLEGIEKWNANPHSSKVGEARRIITGWLHLSLKRVKNGREPYPQDMSRYKKMVMDENVLCTELPEKYKWIVGFDVLPSLEWVKGGSTGDDRQEKIVRIGSIGGSSGGSTGELSIQAMVLPERPALGYRSKGFGKHIGFMDYQTG
ncbi:hypothetical protein K469DRAFT_691609 [Zopfia rhizophila CBS 207.26]|uniref:Uncharacterized protein n=1 Tax=Zopfia rhizophila CBS 207.26 TaxID=1314779 RepID=A0A6A6DR21_9PEZI|nr:hypothetical protein K469DRAFT_691609 [Zopfia rhizophila CBS 207.26]